MNEMPIIIKLSLAAAVNDENAVKDIIQGSLEEISKKYIDISHDYYFEDLPFVVAGMRIAARTIETIRSESGRSLSKRIESNTESVVIDLSKLKEQVKGESDEAVED